MNVCVRVDSITLQALMVPQESVLSAMRPHTSRSQACLKDAQSVRQTKEATTTTTLSVLAHQKVSHTLMINACVHLATGTSRTSILVKKNVKSVLEIPINLDQI